MKLAPIRILFALVLVTAAGVAFAAQPAAGTTEEQAAPEAEVTAPAQDEALPIEVEGLFLDADDQAYGPCCFVECNDEKNRCLDQCPPIGDPGYNACFTQCWSDYEDCTNAC